MSRGSAGAGSTIGIGFLKTTESGGKGRLGKVGKFTLEIVKRADYAEGFEALPRRCVVERTFARLGRCRRLARDFENMIASSEAWIYVANIRFLTPRIARAGYRYIHFDSGSKNVRYI
ncbi:MAG: transposase [Brucella intermedia]